jgi:putative tricarboxylic transport membrane protein
MSAEILLSSLTIVLQPNVVAVVFLASLYGLFIGAVPGLTATMATALLVPITFYMDPLSAIAAIISSSAMAITAGDIPGALLRIPGTPASAAYVDESHAMHRRGKTELALGISIVFSALGGMIGAVVLLIAAPFLAAVALNFSSFEFFWVAVVGLMTSALISTGSPAKGLLSLLLGMFISTIGIDIASGQPRFTGGYRELYSGISFIPVMIGIFAFAEFLREISTTPEHLIARERIGIKKSPFAGLRGLLIKYPWSFVRGVSLGTAVGTMPGVGGDVAAWLSYGVSKKLSKEPEKFGSGHEEGLIEAASSNNSALSSAWVPALVFGIPGDTITAIAIGVLFMKGLNPGPQLFVDNPTMFTSIILVFFAANLVMIPIGYAAIRVSTYILSVPRNFVMPIVLVFCFVGSYAVNNSAFDVVIMLTAGVVGYFLEANKFPIAPIILGLVLGPVVEQNMIMSLQIGDGNPLAFFARPVSGALGLLVAGIVAYSIFASLGMGRSISIRTVTRVDKSDQ